MTAHTHRHIPVGYTVMEEPNPKPSIDQPLRAGSVRTSLFIPKYLNVIVMACECTDWKLVEMPIDEWAKRLERRSDPKV